MLLGEEVCKECEGCAYYWENTDTENECNGDVEICDDYIEFKGVGH